MTHPAPLPATLTSKTYSALRRGGAPPAHAQAQLGLQARIAGRLEEMFLARRDPARPRFARHAAHIAAVLTLGGYPVLPERRR